MRGAVLAGDAETIGHAEIWRQRLGGALPDAWPFAVATWLGLDDVLPRMPAFRDHTVAIAKAVAARGVATVTPDPPLTPLFHVLLPIDAEAATTARDELIAERGVQVFSRARTETVPNVHPDAWIAPTATLIGDVTVEADASVWYGAVIRADFGAIVIRVGANVQDNSVIHVGMGTCEVGPGATIGHLCVVHDCTIGAEALIGNGATVLDGAVVGPRALVAAGSMGGAQGRRCRGRPSCSARLPRSPCRSRARRRSGSTGTRGSTRSWRAGTGTASSPSRAVVARRTKPSFSRIGLLVGSASVRR